ncbi:DM13 domain-containing protein [soil metagenome]
MGALCPLSIVTDNVMPMRIFTKRSLTIGAVVIGMSALIVAWWLASPLFLDSVVDEEFPVAADTTEDANPDSTTMPTAETGGESEEPVSDGSGAPNVVRPTAPVEVTTVASGRFRDADDSHRGSGTAVIYQLEDGSTLLRFEDFEVTNGPDLHVYLVPHENPTRSEDLDGYVDLGSLKGNIGDQNYEIPDGVDISEFGSVVIYCVPFHVLFSIASLG